MPYLIFVFLFSSSLFGYELHLSKHFEEKLLPDGLQINFSLTLRGTDTDQIKTQLHDIAVEMQRYTFCQGGAYTLSPQYAYEEKKLRKLLGYSGTMNYECALAEVEKLEDVFALFGAYKELELYQGSLHWGVDQKKIQHAKENLELQAIRYAKHYRTTLLAHNLAECTATKISLEIDHYTPMRESVRALKSSSAIVAPTKEEIGVKLRASYVYECREF